MLRRIDFKEVIKKLAKKSLEEKWYKIRDKGFDRKSSLLRNCAFCEHAVRQSKKSRKKRSIPCRDFCLISKYEICYHIEEDTVDLVIQELEKLAKDGEL